MEFGCRPTAHQNHHISAPAAEGTGSGHQTPGPGTRATGPHAGTDTASLQWWAFPPVHLHWDRLWLSFEAGQVGCCRVRAWSRSASTGVLIDQHQNYRHCCFKKPAQMSVALGKHVHEGSRTVHAIVPERTSQLGEEAEPGKI